MSVHSGSRLGELAAFMPGATELFERLGLDCCGHPEISLEDACRAAGLSLPDVLTRLRLSAPPEMERWRDRSLREIIAWVREAFHEKEEEEIDRIFVLFARAEEEVADRAAEVRLLRALFSEVANHLVIHIWREEHEIFPFIERLEQVHSGHMSSAAPSLAPSADPAVDAMRRLREATAGYSRPESPPILAAIRDGLRRFDRGLHRHLHVEDQLLYPRARVLCACPLGAEPPERLLRV